MIRVIFVLFFLWLVKPIFGQEIDTDLLTIKKRMDAVQQFSATVIFDLDVPFIRMPTKSAKITYSKGEKMGFSSTDFVMLPKRGLDFSMSEIFKYPFITVDRGTEKRKGLLLKVVNVIPTDKRSDLAMATLYMDVQAKRIVESEINTRKDGSYILLMSYASNKDILPNYVETTFAIERLKIPFNFMGKDTKIDRKKMRAMETKTGKIKMQIKDYRIKQH
ncbi:MULTISPECIES: hypothetical protein [Olivibacter]|jgi:hypothetical protein|uniref:Uncharacterized protein n=3 Tax=Sphingobacteriaceae TaxID=84566 RepID=F4C5X2_SPHS2|nr:MULTISPECIES: hypothetical protein [Olivibacter]MCL4637490.1 hypothetical protein [Olivibacter sp. UJ_SKK_5.1]MDM8175506.1 hypothetical protein [Olivibacter sp. 47]MDX3914116.1 hypothetical protein [Pseudosphingobacterium sp.]QEL02260.1 hypothetical protein FKG96_16055 [Olivibacter sp. LS-1]